MIINIGGIMKKLSILIFLLAASFILVGCQDRDSDPLGMYANSSTLLHNISVSTLEDVSEISTVVTNDLSGYTVTNHHAAQGLLIIRLNNDLNRRAVWSLLERRLIIGFENYSSIQVLSDSVFGAFIKLTYQDGTISYKDIKGVTIIQQDHYNFSNVYGVTKDIYENGKFIRTKHYQVIETVRTYDHAIGNTTKVTRLIEVDPKTNGRMITLDQLEPTVSYGDQYNATPVKIKLDTHGLANHYYITLGNLFYVYDSSSNKLVSSFKIPNLSGAGVGAIFDGKYFYQVNYLMSSDSDNFTYASNGQKYLHKTYVVDMKSGIEKEVNVDYLISSLRGFSNASNNKVYGFAQIIPITSKLLETQKSKDYIIDSQGNLLEDVTTKRLNNLRMISENRYYDMNNRLVLDDSLTPIFTVPSGAVFNYREQIIIFSINGLFGAVDFDGNVVVSFKYTQISNNFYQGKTHAKTTSNTPVIIDLTGNENSYPTTFTYIMNGLFFVRVPVQGTSFYDYQIYNYNKEMLAVAENQTANAQIHSVSNIFGEYKIIQIGSNSLYSYITISVNS